jgi:hypothetical protein
MADLSVKAILESDDNMRGAKFDPKWRYSLVRENQVFSRELDGYTILVENVIGASGEWLVLMGRDKSVVA